MRKELIEIRQELKKSLADLFRLQEENTEALKVLRVNDDGWKESGSIIFWMAIRSSENLIRQLDKLIDSLPKEKRNKKDASMSVRIRTGKSRETRRPSS